MANMAAKALCFRMVWIVIFCGETERNLLFGQGSGTGRRAGAPTLVHRPKSSCAIGYGGGRAKSAVFDRAMEDARAFSPISALFVSHWSRPVPSSRLELEENSSRLLHTNFRVDALGSAPLKLLRKQPQMDADEHR